MVRKRKFNFRGKFSWICHVILIYIVLLIIFLTIIKLRDALTIEDKLNFLKSSRNLSHYIKPLEETEIYRPKNIHEVDRTDVVLFVSSGFNNFKHRNVIRRIYRKHLNPIFLVGKLKDDKKMEKIFNEARIFNDIFVEDFIDSYQNLTIKTGFILKNFLKYFGTSKYLLKMDDDVFLNVPEFRAFLNKNTADIIGDKLENHKPFRTRLSKYYVPAWIYEKEFYPPFITGSFTLIKGSKVRAILETAIDTPMITAEDVYYTGVVAQKLGLNVQNSDKIMGEMYFYNQCRLRNFVAVHGFSPNELLEISDSFENQKFSRCNFYRLLFHNIF